MPTHFQWGGHKNIDQSQEVAWKKLKKGPLRDYETGFYSPVALTVLEKISKDFVFHFLGVIVSEKMFKEKLK
jgi:hypothetical protein